MKYQFRVIALLFAVASLAGCGTPGAPLPPSLELSRPADNLTAVRKGNKVYLTWTAPTQTTDGQNVRAKRMGPAQVCRAVGIFPMTTCSQDVGQIPATEIQLAKPGERPIYIQFTDTLPEQLEREHPTEFASYGVGMLNWRGRSAGLSNQVRIPLAPVLAPPTSITANVTADGINLSFPCRRIQSTSMKELYRVYRRSEGNKKAVLVAEFTPEALELSDSGGCQAKLTDTTFEWEKNYFYVVTPISLVTKNSKQIAEVEGDDSPEVKVFTRDIFPPAQPTGVQAVYSGPGQKPFIDLTWAPNTEPDLAGYNVYRREDGQPEAKINVEPVKTPSYRDENVQPGHAYSYSVTAVDLRGNQSAKSEETTEKVP